jgi:hypothetical protein
MGNPSAQLCVDVHMEHVLLELFGLLVDTLAEVALRAVLEIALSVMDPYGSYTIPL